MRILRVARFAARFPFTIAPETMALAHHGGERRGGRAGRRARMAGAFPGLVEARPRACSRCCTKAARLPHVLPEIATLYLEPERTAAAMRLLDEAARQDATQNAVRGVGRVLDPLALESLAHRLKLPGASGTFRSSRRGTQT